MLCRFDFSVVASHPATRVVAAAGLLLLTALPVVAQDRGESADQFAQLRRELHELHERLARIDGKMEAILDRLNQGPRPDMGPPRRPPAPPEGQRVDRQRVEHRRIEIRRDGDQADRGAGERRPPDRERAERERERDRNEARNDRRGQLEREMHELERLAEEGNPDVARQARREMLEIRELLQREHRPRYARSDPDSPDRLRAEIQELENHMVRLESEGNEDEAHAVRRRIEEMVEELHERERRGGEDEERRVAQHQREEREHDQHRQHQQEVEELRALVEKLKHELEAVHEERNR